MDGPPIGYSLMPEVDSAIIGFGIVLGRADEVRCGGTTMGVSEGGGGHY